MHTWIFLKKPYVHCVLNRFVFVRCEAAYVISCCWQLKKMLLCLQCWYRRCFLFFWNKTLCFSIRTRLYRYRYPFNIQYFFDSKLFYVSIRVRRYRHWYPLNGPFMLLGEHKCFNGAGIGVGFYKHMLRSSIRTLQYRYRYFLKGSFFVAIRSLWFVRCWLRGLFFEKWSICTCWYRYRYPLMGSFGLKKHFSYL
jgi:hypothetical protein